jgi:hypothetical protein
LCVVLVCRGIFQEASLNRTDKENRGKRRKKKVPGISAKNPQRSFCLGLEPSVVHCCVYVFFLRTKDDGRKKAKENKPPVSDPCPVANASKYPAPDPAMWCCGR